MTLIPRDDEIGGSWARQTIYAQDSGISLAYPLRTLILMSRDRLLPELAYL